MEGIFQLVQELEKKGETVRTEAVLLVSVLLFLLDDCGKCEDASDIYMRRILCWTSVSMPARGIASSPSLS